MKKRLILILLVPVLLITARIISYSAKSKVQGISDTNLTAVYGLVLPHHELANSLIMSALTTISRSQTFDRIIVLGPNHFYPDSSRIVTANQLKDYRIDSDFVSSLTELPYVTIENNIADGEHSVGVPIKYLANVYPEALFIPVIISPHYDNQYLNAVADFLTGNSKGRVLYVLSTDFAHNKNVDEGLGNNQETIEAISAFDYAKVLSFDDSYLDSPVATAIFMKIMEKSGATKWETLYSSHGALLENVANLNGTSYVIGTFSKKMAE